MSMLNKIDFIKSFLGISFLVSLVYHKKILQPFFAKVFFC